ncbi:MAG: hypothetical protein J6X55_14735 [Victivallales bacterium]|nr:hypothetical protein [Victivallales bacterium]
MKPHLRKIFFWDAPAQGAFFGLTLLLTSAWGIICIIFTVFTYYRTLFHEISATLLRATFPVILLYILVLCLHFMVARNPFRLLCHLSSCIQVILCLLAWTGAFHVFWTILAYSYHPFRPGGLKGPYSNEYLECLPYVKHFLTWFGIDGSGCFWFALLGVVFLVFAYCLSAKLIATSGQLPMRRLFGRGVLALWGMFLASYILFTGAALLERSRFHRELQKLEEHFGRPPTAKALSQVFYDDSRSCNPDFWKQFEENLDAFNGGKDEYDYVYERQPFGIMPPGIYEKRKQVFQERKGHEALDAQLSETLPLPYRKFSDDDLLNAMPLPELSLLREATRMEMQHLRFALDDRKFDESSACLARLDNMILYLLDDFALISHLCGYAIGQMRFEAFERMLASGLASNDWLESQSKTLLELEKRFLHSEKRLLYGEAAITLSVLRNPAKIGWEGEKHIHFPSLRFFFPQGWWGVEYNRKCLVRMFQVEHFSQMPAGPTGSALVNVVVSGYSKVPQKRQAFLASIRILRSLIDAELHFRKTGKYPDALDTLLQDPFSDKPLKYALGDCKFNRHVYHVYKEMPEYKDSWESMPPFDFFREETNIKAVQIWSVGPDGIDDGGLNKKAEYGSEQKSTDDIRFILPIHQ